MGVTYIDKSGPWLKRVEAAAETGLDAATQYLSTKMVESMPAAPIPVGQGGWKKTSRFHSAPGQPPFRQTGQLSRSVSNGRVGTLRWAAGTIRGQAQTKDGQHNYGYLLEFGTSKMAARPWLRPALYNNTTGIEREFNRAFASKMGAGS